MDEMDFHLNPSLPPQKQNTVKPRYSEFQGTGQNYVLNRGFHYCQHENNYENTSQDQNLHALLAELY